MLAGAYEVSGEMMAQKPTDACRMSACRTVLLLLPFRALPPLLSLFLAVPAICRPDDFWKHKPPAQWTADEALKLVRRSPWARLEVVPLLRRESDPAFSIPTGTKHCDTDAIDKNGNCTQQGRIEMPVDSSRQLDAAPQLMPSASMLVRWESAAPVAQAFVRLEELGQRATVAFQAPSPRLPEDRYVITVKLEQPGRSGFEPFAVTPAGKTVLHATLKTRRGTVAPLEVEFTGAGANSAAHFFFPRTLDGAPLIGPGRDSAEFTLQGASFVVHSKFTLDPGLLP
ncbi:MAG TPA: hypothetical protein VFQ18_07045 [Candidatus Acidoferrum sp.]|jgi:hypothetical protein|nr:hypothetical protein [Candidatus Acidoferrum sp.]